MNIKTTYSSHNKPIYRLITGDLKITKNCVPRVRIRRKRGRWSCFLLDWHKNPRFLCKFAGVLFRVLYPEKRMKRESGESPEQSRCCEFHARCIILVPLFFGKNGKAMYRERVRRPAKQSRKIVHSRKVGSAQMV